MRTKNSLFDQVEDVKDGKLYAVNVHLKSGQIVHLEHLEKGEKDAYVNYARTGREKMLIETNKMVWRIMPDDVERVVVKSYSNQQANGVYPFMRFAMTKSRFDTSLFTRFIFFFVILLIGVVAFQVFRAMLIEDPMSIIVDYKLLAPFMDEASDMFGKFGWLLIFVMIALNIVDLLLRSSEKFYILDEERPFLEGSKVFHVLITIGCVIGFQFVNSLFFGILKSVMS